MTKDNCNCIYTKSDHATGNCGCHISCDMDYKECKYYTTYLGPKMVSIEINEVSDVNLYDKLNGLYGNKCNWN
jgi:hypothetical protein